MYCNVKSSDHVIQTSQKNTNIIKKIIKIFFPKLIRNYFIGVTPLTKLEVTPYPQPRKCMFHALMSMKDTVRYHAEFFQLAIVIQRIDMFYL